MSVSGLETLAEKIMARLPEEGRAIIALTGPPGSGKSTCAESLAGELETLGRCVQIVPMDGFHLDNRLLEASGLLPRKGAPETFDLAGFTHLITRLRSEPVIIYPLFDRERDIAVAGAGEVSADCDCIIVEGNYLLFDEPGWRELAPFWDISIHLTVSENLLRARLVQRWRDHGLAEEAAQDRAERNDMANARRISAAALPADLAWGCEE